MPPLQPTYEYRPTSSADIDETFEHYQELQDDLAVSVLSIMAEIKRNMPPVKHGLLSRITGRLEPLKSPTVAYGIEPPDSNENIHSIVNAWIESPTVHGKAAVLYTQQAINVPAHNAGLDQDAELDRATFTPVADPEARFTIPLHFADQPVTFLPADVELLPFSTRLTMLTDAVDTINLITKEVFPTDSTLYS